MSNTSFTEHADHNFGLMLWGIRITNGVIVPRHRDALGVVRGAQGPLGGSRYRYGFIFSFSFLPPHCLSLVTSCCPSLHSLHPHFQPAVT